MDWSQPVSGAIGGAFGLLGSYLNYKYQTQLAEKQNEYNLNMWNLQNEYNSPSAQMRRYEEAGLNPALMYGQVTPGNASSAPAQVTPNAPNVSQDLKDLAKAFNIEGIKQAIADTKFKQANAKSAEIDAERNRQQFRAERNVGLNWTMDPETGMFVKRPYSKSPDEVIMVDPASYYVNKILADNYRTNSLLVPRSGLISSQAALNSARSGQIPLANFILRKRGEMFAPQLRMLNYESKYFPVNYWIGNVKQGVQTATPFITPFF